MHLLINCIQFIWAIESHFKHFAASFKLKCFVITEFHDRYEWLNPYPLERQNIPGFTHVKQA